MPMHEREIVLLVENYRYTSIGFIKNLIHTSGVLKEQEI